MKLFITLGLGAAAIITACGGAAASPSAPSAQGSSAATPPPAAATLPPAAATLPSAAATLPAASASVVPSAPASSAGSDLVARGKVVFETAGTYGCVKCHGPEGKGGITETGESAPDIRGLGYDKVRPAVSGGVGLMAFLKLTEDEIDAVVAYLQYLNK